MISSSILSGMSTTKLIIRKSAAEKRFHSSSVSSVTLSTPTGSPLLTGNGHSRESLSFIGFLDPTDGGSAFALVVPALAAAHGADFVEKRLTLDRSRKRRDGAAALSPEDFYRTVELLHQAERARGDSEPRAPQAARGRSIVAATLIGRGEVLTAEMLSFKRTDERFERGLAPSEAHRVIGRRAGRPIQADETIREDMLQ